MSLSPNHCQRREGLPFLQVLFGRFQATRGFGFRISHAHSLGRGLIVHCQELARNHAETGHQSYKVPENNAIKGEHTRVNIFPFSVLPPLYYSFQCHPYVWYRDYSA